MSFLSCKKLQFLGLASGLAAVGFTSFARVAQADDSRILETRIPRSDADRFPELSGVMLAFSADGNELPTVAGPFAGGTYLLRFSAFQAQEGSGRGKDGRFYRYKKEDKTYCYVLEVKLGKKGALKIQDIAIDGNCSKTKVSADELSLAYDQLYAKNELASKSSVANAPVSSPSSPKNKVSQSEVDRLLARRNEEDAKQRKFEPLADPTLCLKENTEVLRGILNFQDGIKAGLADLRLDGKRPEQSIFEVERKFLEAAESAIQFVNRLPAPVFKDASLGRESDVLKGLLQKQKTIFAAKVVEIVNKKDKSIDPVTDILVSLLDQSGVAFCVADLMRMPEWYGPALAWEREASPLLRKALADQRKQERKAYRKRKPGNDLTPPKDEKVQDLLDDEEAKSLVFMVQQLSKARIALAKLDTERVQNAKRANAQYEAAARELARQNSLEIKEQSRDVIAFPSPWSGGPEAAEHEQQEPPMPEVTKSQKRNLFVPCHHQVVVSPEPSAARAPEKTVPVVDRNKGDGFWAKLGRGFKSVLFLNRGSRKPTKRQATRVVNDLDTKKVITEPNLISLGTPNFRLSIEEVNQLLNGQLKDIPIASNSVGKTPALKNSNQTSAQTDILGDPIPSVQGAGESESSGQNLEQTAIAGCSVLERRAGFDFMIGTIRTAIQIHQERLVQGHMMSGALY